MHSFVTLRSRWREARRGGGGVTRRRLPGGGRDPTLKQVEIDVAAGKNEADALARQTPALLQRRREAGGAGALGEIMRVGPIGANRLGDFVVVDEHDARRAAADDVERLSSGARVAMPSASVSLVAVVTTRPAASDSA